MLMPAETKEGGRGLPWVPKEADGFSPRNLIGVWETRAGFPRRPEHPASTGPFMGEEASLAPAQDVIMPTVENSQHGNVRGPPRTPQVPRGTETHKIILWKSNGILAASANQDNYRYLLKHTFTSTRKKRWRSCAERNSARSAARRGRGPAAHPSPGSRH